MTPEQERRVTSGQCAVTTWAAAAEPQGLKLDLVCLSLMCFLIGITSLVEFCLVQGFKTPYALQAYNERLPSTWHIINHKVRPHVCRTHSRFNTASLGLAAA